MSIKAISRHLDVARGTVRRFARAAQPEDLLAKTLGRGQGRPSIVDQYADYIHQRLAEGTAEPTSTFSEDASYSLSENQAGSTTFTESGSDPVEAER